MSLPNENRGLPTEITPMATVSPACCSLHRWMTPLLVVVTIASISIAAYFAGRSSTASADDTNQWANLPLINATAAVTSEKYSIATGVVSEESEGLFVLDHNSGLLQCNVIYPRTGGQFMAQFTINVAETLGTAGKAGNYMIVTGHAQFPRASNRPAASTVVYVMDTATGNYASYGIPFDRVAMNANRPQQGALILLSTGSANPVIDRDQLR